MEVVACNYSIVYTKPMARICMLSHQAKLIEVGIQPPGINISQAVPHLQVCQCSWKHLKATQKPERQKRLRVSIVPVLHFYGNHKEEPQWQEFNDRKNTKQQVFCLGLVYYCISLRLCTDNHLFENHELIQEVNTLAGEEFPDGFLSLEALRVSGGAHLGRLVSQELRQRVVLQKRSDQTRGKNWQEIHLFTPQKVCLYRICCHCKVPTTILLHSNACHCLFLCVQGQPDELLSRNSGSCTSRSLPLTVIVLFLSRLLNTEIYLDLKSESVRSKTHSAWIRNHYTFRSNMIDNTNTLD